MSADQKPVRIGADIGGTFTDLQIYDARHRRIVSHKIATTPEDPSIGLMEGLSAAGARWGFSLGDIGYVLHGTTIATNAVLQRRFPAGALVTTSGFEDVLEIGRHSRREIYSVTPRPAPVLVPRNLRIGVAERMRANGTPELALSETELDRLVDRLAGLDVATVAVSLVNAYVNPAHEEMIAERLARALPALSVSLSSTVSPEIREYERTNTTVLNALLVPVVKSYLDRLARRMREQGLAARLLIVQSNGGVCSPDTAAREPVRVLLSGPSGGALGALTLSQALDQPMLVGVDMGGTSFDVSVVRDSRIEVVTQGEVDRLPVRLPMVEIRTIGAGGGSIARADPSGRVTVGPESAGARPGPVCYGRGGSEPTVTDANLILGRLDPAYFLGGAMPLDLAGARAAIKARFADPIGIDVEPAASGIITITNTNLAAAIRLSLFEKGLDPRDFAILSFGGAGAIHACAVAEELGIARVIFPTDASTFSAWGILRSHIKHDFARARVMPFDAAALGQVTEMAGALEAQANAQLDEDGIAPGDRSLQLAVDLRYKGQAFELTVPWRAEGVDAAALQCAATDFHDMHRQRFSYANPNDVVELVTMRLSAVGRLPEGKAEPPTGTLNDSEAVKERQVWIGGAWRSLPVWQRLAMRPAQTISGPAIVEEEYTTVLIGIGWTATMDPSGHLLARKEKASS